MASKKAEMLTGNRISEIAIPMPAEAGSREDDRLSRIATAAFLRAASRGFSGGDPIEDWLLAEIEVDASLKAR
jgi:hypothetical protein